MNRVLKTGEDAFGFDLDQGVFVLDRLCHKVGIERTCDKDQLAERDGEVEVGEIREEKR